ncbi:putative RNA-binding domain superfamily [Helianthus annuus]|uniref:RNA-binding domain superfamily n=1 Tax=Helianthus annuus TaxID=4232 RepID=A0A9K3E7S0_HELAN|nr:uncharacterized protein LOC110906551 [Helianthus annuus]KAF5767451.1 putative RNA-binding domain superfamily [Helianthus annuus]
MGGEHRNLIPVSVQKRLTKFYVANLPVRCSGSDLAGVVRVHAEIYDIYIARKRDKMGNRFGFVSLLDVKNMGKMEKTPSNIRMGDYKLSFNVARFTLEDGEINNRQTRKPKIKVATEVTGNPIRRKEIGGEPLVGVRSFKDAVLGRSTEMKDEKVITVQDDFKAYEHVIGKAVIVRMVDFKALREAGGCIREMSAGEGLVQYVGGMFIMVSFPSGEEMERFVRLAKEKVDIFQSVEKWAGQTLPFERVVWLRVQGIPLHLLDNVVINRIGESFGKVVQCGQHDERDSDLSYDYVGVLVSEGRKIVEEVIIQWKGRRYRVWVAEETGDWDTEFLAKDKEEGVPPVNRNQSQASENTVNPVENVFMEGPEIVEGNKEGEDYVHNQNIRDEDVSDFNNQSVGVNMEGFENFAGVSKEVNELVGNGLFTANKDKIVFKKVGRRRMGPYKDRMVSVDDRPSSRKRPRMEIDTNGLDPFGLTFFWA